MAPGFYMVLVRTVFNCDTRLCDIFTGSEYKNKNFIEHRPLFPRLQLAWGVRVHSIQEDLARKGKLVSKIDITLSNFSLAPAF